MYKEILICSGKKIEYWRNLKQIRAIISVNANNKKTYGLENLCVATTGQMVRELAQDLV